MIFTFWEGEMPEYIRLCLSTWHFPFEVIDYRTLCQYTELDIERVKRFTLPQIADCVRVHVLRDNGGYWLDADTISVSGNLPTVNIFGDPEERTNTIGFLRTEAHSDMFEKWATFQDKVIDLDYTPTHWDIMGNAFTDKYVRDHPEVIIGDIDTCWPETYMIIGDIDRFCQYREFYFESHNELVNLKKTDLLMLHNSWTPDWYKQLSRDEVLANDCTMSNILRELT